MWLVTPQHVLVYAGDIITESKEFKFRTLIKYKIK